MTDDICTHLQAKHFTILPAVSLQVKVRPFAYKLSSHLKKTNVSHSLHGKIRKGEKIQPFYAPQPPFYSPPHTTLWKHSRHLLNCYSHETRASSSASFQRACCSCCLQLASPNWAVYIPCGGNQIIWVNTTSEPGVNKGECKKNGIFGDFFRVNATSQPGLGSK